MAAYATANDMIERHDIRVICDLLGDDDSPVSREDVASHATMATALKAASGKVDAKLRTGKRYTPAQLVGLDENSEEHLKDIVCTTAMAWLFRRRPGVHEEIAKSIRELSDEELKSLATGEDVFGLDGTEPHVDAGVPQISGPTSVQVENRNFLAARLSGKHIPDIVERNPLDRG
jgi:phage gp36-like protein